MGTVYRALDRVLDREVAIKVFRPELPSPGRSAVWSGKPESWPASSIRASCRCTMLGTLPTVASTT